MADELLTTGQVADLLNVHAQTVRRWIENGNLRAIRLPSGVWRIKRAEVSRLLGEEAVA